MITNAKTYNQEGSWVYNDAVELMDTFEERYNALAKFSGLPGSENEGAAQGARGGGGADDEDEEDEDEDEEDSKDNVRVAPPSSSRPKIKLSMKGRGSIKSSSGKRGGNDSDAGMDDED